MSTSTNEDALVQDPANHERCFDQVPVQEGERKGKRWISQQVATHGLSQEPQLAQLSPKQVGMILEILKDAGRIQFLADGGGMYWRTATVVTEPQSPSKDEKGEQRSEEPPDSKPEKNPPPSSSNGFLQREAAARKTILACEEHKLFPPSKIKGPTVVNGWSGDFLFVQLTAAEAIVSALEEVERDQKHPLIALSQERIRVLTEELHKFPLLQDVQEFRKKAGLFDDLRQVAPRLTSDSLRLYLEGEAELQQWKKLLQSLRDDDVRSASDVGDLIGTLKKRRARAERHRWWLAALVVVTIFLSVCWGATQHVSWPAYPSAKQETKEKSDDDVGKKLLEIKNRYKKTSKKGTGS